MVENDALQLVIETIGRDIHRRTSRSALTEQVIIYQRSKLQKIDRRLAEFDFRYNNRSGLGVEDTERVAKIAKNVGSIAAQSAGRRGSWRPTFPASSRPTQC
jgi:hypothetical protein